MSRTSKEPFLPLIRALAEAYQAFEQFSAHQVRKSGLTPAQFDVVATLGNTPGMCCKTLSQKTLITKGTLTGVLDRLAEKGVISRTPLPEDRRSVFVALTPAGEALFERVFPAQIRYARTAFEGFTPQEIETQTQKLLQLKGAFIHALEQQS